MRTSGNSPTSGAVSVAKSGAGTWVLSGANTYSGTTTLSAGTLVVGNNSALGTGTLALAGGSLQGDGTARSLANNLSLTANSSVAGNSALTFNGTLTNTATATLTIANTGATAFGAINLTNSSTARTLTFDVGGTATVAGVIANGTGIGSFTKIGAGSLTLSGASTYTGATAVNAGTLRVNGSLANTAVTIAGGATLGGSGTIAGGITLNGRLSPGNSPGLLTTGSETWNTGSSYVWQASAVNGLAGTGWDQVKINGTLDLTQLASVGSFTLSLASLGLDNTAGNVSDFNDASNYSFAFLTTTGGVNGFDAAKFTLDTSAFSNPFRGTWSVGLSGDGHTLNLNYAMAVPEPGTTAALIATLALGAAVILRRRR